MTDPSTQPTDAHCALKVWVGKWRAEGQSYDFDGPSQKWKSEEDYEMLPGDYFLVQRWDEHGGAEPFKGLGVISWDEDKRVYQARAFENHGHYRNYQVRRDGARWTFDGDTERARYRFSADGRTCDIEWDFRPPGGAWTRLCERTAKRVD